MTQREEDLLLQVGQCSSYLSHSINLIFILFSFLPAGSVILVEDAVSSVVVEEQSHRYCDYCCKKIPLQVISNNDDDNDDQLIISLIQVTPCRYSAEVAYCSPLCRAKARGRFYKML